MCHVQQELPFPATFIHCLNSVQKPEVNAVLRQTPTGRKQPRDRLCFPTGNHRETVSARSLKPTGKDGLSEQGAHAEGVAGSMWQRHPGAFRPTL